MSKVNNVVVNKKYFIYIASYVACFFRIGVESMFLAWGGNDEETEGVGAFGEDNITLNLKEGLCLRYI